VSAGGGRRGHELLLARMRVAAGKLDRRGGESLVSRRAALGTEVTFHCKRACALDHPLPAGPTKTPGAARGQELAPL